MSFVAKQLDTTPWRCQAKIPCRGLAAGEDKLTFAQEQVVRLCKWSKVPGHFTKPDFTKAKKSNDGKSHFLSWIPDEAMLAFLQSKADEFGLVKGGFLGVAISIRVYNLVEVIAKRKAKGQDPPESADDLEEDMDEDNGGQDDQVQPDQSGPGPSRDPTRRDGNGQGDGARGDSSKSTPPSSTPPAPPSANQATDQVVQPVQEGPRSDCNVVLPQSDNT